MHSKRLWNFRRIQRNFLSLQQSRNCMGKIIGSKTTKIITNDGIQLIRRVTTVRMPNGHYRYPVDYYEASSKPIEMTKDKLDKIRIPVYKQLI